MSNDKLMDLCMDTIEKCISDLRKKGKTDSELLEIVKKIKYEKLIRDTAEVTSQGTVDYFKSHMFEIAYEEKNKTDEFIAHQNLIWGRCFAASQAMYVMAVEAAEMYSKFVAEDLNEEMQKSKQFTFLALQHMHGRACQEFLEILYLMRLGFADGAYARWRSMYELGCCAYFIQDQGEKIAEQYFKKSCEYKNTETSSSVAEKYSWMDGATNKSGKEITGRSFSTIQKYCINNNALDESWSKQYRLACSVNHASPEGTFKRLGNGPNSNAIPVGHSDFGITTAAEHSAAILQWITSLFLSVFNNLEAISIKEAMLQWVNVIRDYYLSTANEVFGEEIGKQEEENVTE